MGEGKEGKKMIGRREWRGQGRLGWSKRISQVVRQFGLDKGMEGNWRLVGGTGEGEVWREGLPWM